MPVSKNKRKNKKGQSRKENKAKAANNSDGGGIPATVEYHTPVAQESDILGLRPVGMSMGGSAKYRATSPPDDPALSEMEQIDAIIERSVAFEMTDAHHDNIGLREIELHGETQGGDILGPMVAMIQVDPLATIEEHPRWKTGQELIEYLDSDPNVFRGEFNGNRWQGSGVQWGQCPPTVKDCPDRLEINQCGNAPTCSQCNTEVDPKETHFHILEEEDIPTLCEKCWSKGPLPEEDQTLELEFPTPSQEK